MSRVKKGMSKRRKHNKILKMAKGYRSSGGACFKTAKQRVEKGLQYAYRDRRNIKRVFRALWIQRLNAAVRVYGMKYSRFIHCLKSAKIELNRKMLAKLAMEDAEAFASIMKCVKNVAN